MGRRLRQQRRGRGTSTFRAKGKGIKAEYVSLNEKQRNSSVEGQVLDLIKESGRNSILALIKFEDGSTNYVIAAEGLSVGQSISYGKKSAIAIGNVLPLNEVPEGCPVFDIELEPGDGGKLVKGTGVYALLVTKGQKTANVKLPSGKTIELDLASRATIGCSAGGGRKEKPMIKAGTKFHLMASKSRAYLHARGVAMNAVDHPFGGSQHHAGKSKSTSRHAPPGRKVGNIASKRTGRRKKN
ncbi:MAG: 50S ribosomal protein L2 [Candidatus Diapherotrites archaeon]|uniref:50S ribosomal protein L2 n=1 Tax=Candidatus Iainarchaeum sp. TaxID=3101447 RepID=A0A939C6R1_9ARCH|nr:50S ribosomal protein L2 [Candidatus Diapherotrites archaeon]